MSPWEFLAVLDDAIAQAPRGRRKVALELHVPGGELWGIHGRALGSDDKGPVYGFTRAQCHEMRVKILDAAKQDTTAPDVIPADWTYTGDVP
jgi:hypothetical protein